MSDKDGIEDQAGVFKKYEKKSSEDSFEVIREKAWEKATRRYSKKSQKSKQA